VQNNDSFSLFDDLDAALQSGSSEKRVAMFRQVTDRLLGEADRSNETQIGVFDNVQLIERIESKTLAEIRLKIDFERLSKSNAQRLLRFWQVREVSARSA
jgi:hypothetical protein